jgi:hypothetical protein
VGSGDRCKVVSVECGEVDEEDIGAYIHGGVCIFIFRGLDIQLMSTLDGYNLVGVDRMSSR